MGPRTRRIVTLAALVGLLPVIALIVLVLGGIYAISAASIVVTYVSAGVLNFAFGAIAFFIAVALLLPLREPRSIIPPAWVQANAWVLPTIERQPTTTPSLFTPFAELLKPPI
jgi:branched-subunit amino acid ABC-type transport system permease component